LVDAHAGAEGAGRPLLAHAAGGEVAAPDVAQHAALCVRGGQLLARRLLADLLVDLPLHGRPERGRAPLGHQLVRSAATNVRRGGGLLGLGGPEHPAGLLGGEVRAAAGGHLLVAAEKVELLCARCVRLAHLPVGGSEGAGIALGQTAAPVAQSVGAAAVFVGPGVLVQRLGLVGLVDLLLGPVVGRCGASECDGGGDGEHGHG